LLLYMSLMKWVVTRIPVNGANKLDQCRCYCMNSSDKWTVQLEGTHHRRTSARATANKEWDSSFVLSLCSVGNKVLYTADQMIWHSDTL
jgi:hypothetical protein